MNIYTVIEGEKATKKIYKNWIPQINPSLTHINYLSDFTNNNFYILAGYGQPRIFERIKSAVDDVNKILKVERLVISIDSEDSTYQEKHKQVEEFIKGLGCRVEIRVIVQHFCMETWLLGNRSSFRKKPSDSNLQNFINLFDVRHNDPELLPGNEENCWNRSQFAFNYLRAGIRDVYTDRKSYTKSEPGITASPGYFFQVKDRYLKEKHIVSFSDFIRAFSN